MMSSSSIMVHIAQCLQELSPFAYEFAHHLKGCRVSNLNNFDQNFRKLGYITLFSTIMSSSLIMVHILQYFLVLLHFVHENSPFLMGSGFF